MIDPNAPALPGQFIVPGDVPCIDFAPGLTIRAHFAAMFLQGMVANPSIIGANARCGWDYVNCTPENVAQAALAQADALIVALNAPSP